MTDEEKPSRWAEIVGPCYTVASMAHTLGWTEREVVDAGNTCRLLMLSTSDDVLLFPSFQLQNGEPVAGLAEILRILETGTRGRWTWAQWLNTELPDANPPRNIEYLYAGRLEEAIRDARRDAGAWSS